MTVTAAERSLALAKLRSSGITQQQAEYAGIKMLSAAQTRALYNSAPATPALQLQYLGLSGRPTGLYRLRVLQPPPGFQLTKPQRYYQPPSTLPQVYFPRVKGVNWLELLSNADHNLLITEGELKALSATLHELPTLGLGGVWNWRSAKNNVSLIDELKSINWKGRHVYICYDSDAVTKPQVAEAMLHFAHELSKYGAHVYDAGLPELGSAEKTGLDDYLVARGERALRNHLNKADPVQSVESLHDFNMRYCYVRNMDVVIELSTGMLHEGGRFVNRVAANEKFEVQKATADGGVKMIQKSTAKEWMEWPQRNEVQALDYQPGQDKVMFPGPRYNTWTGWGVTPASGSVALWNELIAFLFKDTEPEAKEWFLRWCAWPLQNPGDKMFTAVAMWSVGTGTGKTLIGETLLKLYGRNGSLIAQTDLESAFNDWLVGKQFIVGDEVTGNESRKHADQLKGLLTSKTINVNRKFQPRYELPNRANFYFTSNHPDSFFLEDFDRRFLVIEAPLMPLAQDFYDRYDKWLRSDAGPAALFHHLLQLPVGNFNPRAPAMITAAKQRMIEDNKSDLGDWVLRLKRDPMAVLPYINGHAPREFFSNHELLAFYDPQDNKRATANGLGRELKRAGFSYVCGGMPITADGFSKARYYAVINEAKWRRARLTEARKHLEERRFGGKEKF